MTICTKCKNKKEENKFPHRGDNPKRKGSWCRDCLNQWNRESYHSKGSHRRDRVQKREKEVNEWYKSLKLSLSCMCCSENHPACTQFHHRDESIKEFNISEAAVRGYSKQRILEEIEKCDVLCANCHFKKHWQLAQLEEQSALTR